MLPRHRTHRARTVHNLLQGRALQGLDDEPFRDGFVGGRIPPPLWFPFGNINTQWLFLGQSCPRLRLRVSTQWFFSISSGALCGQARGIRKSSDGLERSIACTPGARRACERRQVVACARRKQRCSGAEAAGAVQMQRQMACNATANAGVRARAAAPSTARASASASRSAWSALDFFRRAALAFEVRFDPLVFPTISNCHAS